LKTLLIIFSFLISLAVHAQEPVAIDSTAKEEKSFGQKFSEKWKMKPHSPLKATIYSAVLPGAGQVYNHKAWKALIAVGGLGTCIGFIVYNNDQYQYFHSQYIAQVDGDPNTVVTASPTLDLFKTQENYHQLRDISYICLGAVYFLQLIDANVDGHLFYYDVSDDLSLNFHPSLVRTTSTHPAIGLTMKF